MDKELIANRLFTHAVFPVIKVVLQDDEFYKKQFARVKARVALIAEGKGGVLCFDNGDFSVDYKNLDVADITFKFSSVKKMNDFLRGKTVLPKISGITKVSLLVKVILLLNSLKIMMPNVRPKKEDKKYLKVKMAFYMATTSLSQLNKAGDPDMQKWVAKQPDRIYQIEVDGTDIAAYLRVKAGKSKAGRGIYKRKRPFVKMKLNGLDGAMAILLRDVEFVGAVDKGYVTVEGAPEYAAQLNDYMMRIQALTT
jgi:hypothetical protein